MFSVFCAAFCRKPLRLKSLSAHPALGSFSAGNLAARKARLGTSTPTGCLVLPPFGGVAPAALVRLKRPVFSLFRGRRRSFFSFQSFLLDLFRHRLARTEGDDIFCRDFDGFTGQRISRLVSGPTFHFKNAEIP